MRRLRRGGESQSIPDYDSAAISAAVCDRQTLCVSVAGRWTPDMSTTSTRWLLSAPSQLISGVSLPGVTALTFSVNYKQKTLDFWLLAKSPWLFVYLLVRHLASTPASTQVCAHAQERNVSGSWYRIRVRLTYPVPRLGRGRRFPTPQRLSF